jgi:hypothetical protein
MEQFEKNGAKFPPHHDHYSKFMYKNKNIPDYKAHEIDDQPSHGDVRS